MILTVAIASLKSIMTATREQKKKVLDTLGRVFSSAASVVFVHYKGVPVDEEQAMRRALKEKAVGYTVAKKSLTKRALEGATIKGETPEFSGELALAWSDSLTDTAREVYTFQKKYKDRVQIIGGIFDGEFKNKEQMTEIAEIPSLQTLRAQFVNLINSPLQGLVIALNAVAEKGEKVA
jgi:large subunit ribosomal protein L10